MERRQLSFQWKYAIGLLAMLMIGTSCHHNEPEFGVDFSSLPSRGKVFVPYREGNHDISQDQSWQYLNEEVLFDESGEIIEWQACPRRASSLNMTDLARGLLESTTSRIVHQVCGTYTSVGVNGEELTLSGAVYYPTERTIKNVILCSHYTVSANYEVPSETFPIEAALAALGYVVVMPDYIGYGVTKNMVHPYLQSYLTGYNVIDMALAVRPFLAERQLTIESDSIILLGYSQGGATSYFVQMLMENDEEYAGLFKIKKNYCGGGPYDVARTYDYCVNRDETGIPYAVPMIILGMSEGLSKPLDMTQFFQEPLLSNYKDWFNTKAYNGTQLTKMIGVNRLSKILTPAGMDRSKGETQRLYRLLIKNSIPTTFVPKAPVYMFHSMDDQTVPFVNAQLVRGRLRGASAQIEYDFGHYGTHQKGCIKFVMNMVKELK